MKSLKSSGMQAEDFDECWDRIGEELDVLGDLVLQYKEQRDAMIIEFAQALEEAADDPTAHLDIILEYAKYVADIDDSVRPAHQRLTELMEEIKIMKTVKLDMERETDEWN